MQRSIGVDWVGYFRCESAMNVQEPRVWPWVYIFPKVSTSRVPPDLWSSLSWGVISSGMPIIINAINCLKLFSRFYHFFFFQGRGLVLFFPKSLGTCYCLSYQTRSAKDVYLQFFYIHLRPIECFCEFQYAYHSMVYSAHNHCSQRWRCSGFVTGWPGDWQPLEDFIFFFG